MVYTGQRRAVWGHGDPELNVCAQTCVQVCGKHREDGRRAGKARVLLIGHFGACFLSVCGSPGAARCP